MVVGSCRGVVAVAEWEVRGSVCRWEGGDGGDARRRIGHAAVGERSIKLGQAS